MDVYDDINITPMLDLAYVLLVIFIIMTTATVQGIKVNLPKASAQPTLAENKTKAITHHRRRHDLPRYLPGEHAGAGEPAAPVQGGQSQSAGDHQGGRDASSTSASSTSWISSVGWISRSSGLVTQKIVK